MRILVTGGAGFIGSHIVDALIARRHTVFVVDNLSTGKKEFINPKAKFYRGDICSKKRLATLFQKFRPQCVIHHAAHIDLRQSVADPTHDAKINILGSLNLLEASVQNGVKRFLFSSTGGALYGEANKIPTPESYPTNPISPYGVAKLSVEHYLHYYEKQYGLPTLALRYANVYGPRQNGLGEAGVVAIFCSRIFAKKPLVINGDGKQTRDYVYVADVVNANLQALDSTARGAVNIGTGREVNVNTLLRILALSVHLKVSTAHGPAKPGEQRRSALDARFANRTLGWKPRVDLEEGLAKTFGWFQESG